MNYFYIKSIKVTGSNVKDSIVEFSDGVNLITGHSNTGKTMIIRCIDWLFGKEYEKGKGLPMVESLGYSKVIMELSTKQGSILLTRDISNNKIINVKSNDTLIDSGIYNIDSKSKNSINDVWLKLFGIPTNVKILKSGDRAQQSLTWRTLVPFLITAKETIVSDTSVIFDNEFSHTALQSALLYLYFSDYLTAEEMQTNAEKEIKNTALKKYLETKITLNKKKIDELQRKVTQLENSDINNEINNLIKSIKDVGEILNTHIIQLKSFKEEKSNLEEKIFFITREFNSLKVLKQKYNSEIKRINNIIEGQKVLLDVPQKRKCPVCQTLIKKTVTSEEKEMYIAELSSNIYQLNDLINTISILKNDINELHKNYQICIKNIQETEIQINQLKPTLSNFNLQLDDYKNFISLKNELSSLIEANDEFQKDIDKSNIQFQKLPKYKPAQYFNDKLIETINDNIKYILDAIHFENYENYIVKFDLKEFDIKIDNNYKQNYVGTGYKAILNSTLLLALRKLFATEAKHNPSFFVIDGPFLGLDEKGNPNELKKNFLDYISTTNSQSQLILIENDKNIPWNLINTNSINIIRFNDNEGFLKFK